LAKLGEKSQRGISDRSTIYDEGAENARRENGGHKKAGHENYWHDGLAAFQLQYVATATCSNKNVLCIMYTVALKQLTTGNKNK